jgi:uncharacterized protein
MDVTPLIRTGQKVIQSYAGGIFKISGFVYEHPVIVTPDNVIPWNAPVDFSGLSESDFNFDFYYDVLLLGTGKTMRFLPAPLRAALKDKKISPDMMDTGAACRTYNVLMAEGRAVAAALMPYK